MKLLRRADLDKVSEETRRTLEHISRFYNACQTFAARPGRLKFTLRDDAQFNSTIYVHLFWIYKKMFLHVFYEATRYQAALWVPSASAGNLWQALRLCLIDVYIYLPDVTAHDAGKNVLAESLQRNADLFSIRPKYITV